MFRRRLMYARRVRRCKFNKIFPKIKLLSALQCAEVISLLSKCLYSTKVSLIGLLGYPSF